MNEQAHTQPEPDMTETTTQHAAPETPGPPPYPYYYPPPPQRTSIDTATLALILAAVGFIYWFPPFVLPGVALYLAGKARKEIESGLPVAPNALTFIKTARALAIVNIVVVGLFFLLLILIGILAAIYGS